jgi:hypothetical protein
MIVVTHRALQVGKMVGLHTLPRQRVFTQVKYCLALCALLGGIAMIAVASQREPGVPQRAVITVSAALDAQHDYRYINRSSGVAQVQRSIDGGRTWAHGGLLPEPVLQLEPGPVDDTVVFARTESNLWRSETGGVSWARVANLPGRPLSLAMTARATPTGPIFLGTDDHGLYTSTDSGKTWQAAGGRLSLVGAGALAISALMVNPDPALRALAPASILALIADPAAPAPSAALPGAKADFAANPWAMAVIAALMLLTVLVVVLIWQRPRPAAPVSPA